MALTEIICGHCGVLAMKETSHVNRAIKSGNNLYCSKKCSGKGRRKHKSDSQKKLEKAEYDRAYREKNRDLLKMKKAQYFQRTYDPESASIERKKRAHKHAEYCRRPEYRAWKREYDRTYRANRHYGDYADAFMALQDLTQEILTRASRTEIGVQNGKLTKSQQRKRAFSKRAKSEIGALGHAPIGPHRGDGCGSGRQRRYAGA